MARGGVGSRPPTAGTGTAGIPGPPDVGGVPSRRWLEGTDAGAVPHGVSGRVREPFRGSGGPGPPAAASSGPPPSRPTAIGGCPGGPAPGAGAGSGRRSDRPEWSEIHSFIFICICGLSRRAWEPDRPKPAGRFQPGRRSPKEGTRAGGPVSPGRPMAGPSKAGEPTGSPPPSTGGAPSSRRPYPAWTGSGGGPRGGTAREDGPESVLRAGFRRRGEGPRRRGLRGATAPQRVHCHEAHHQDDHRGEEREVQRGRTSGTARRCRRRWSGGGGDG